MLFLILGALAVFAFLGGLRAFERASVPSLMALLRWAAALGGLALILMLVLTGREAVALGVAVFAAPMLWEWWQPRVRGAQPGEGPGGGPGGRPGGRPEGRPGARSWTRRGTSAMSAAEAYAALGLAPGASAAEIQAAHRRLMRAAHPDAGGDTEQAARLNRARDVLLRGGK